MDSGRPWGRCLEPETALLSWPAFVVRLDVVRRNHLGAAELRQGVRRRPATKVEQSRARDIAPKAGRCPSRTPARRALRAGRTDRGLLHPPHAPPRPLFPRCIVQRQEQPRQHGGLAFISAFAHDVLCSARKSSLLHDEYRDSSKGKLASTISV